MEAVSWVGEMERCRQPDERPARGGMGRNDCALITSRTMMAWNQSAEGTRRGRSVVPFIFHTSKDRLCINIYMKGIS